MNGNESGLDILFPVCAEQEVSGAGWRADRQTGSSGMWREVRSVRLLCEGIPLDSRMPPLSGGNLVCPKRFPFTWCYFSKIVETYVYIACRSTISLLLYDEYIGNYNFVDVEI